MIIFVIKKNPGPKVSKAIITRSVYRFFLKFASKIDLMILNIQSIHNYPRHVKTGKNVKNDTFEKHNSKKCQQVFLKFASKIDLEILTFDQFTQIIVKN